MIVHLTARSIGRPAAETLRRAPFAARVLASFEQACDLVTPGGQVIAVVTPRVGDGPLNIVAEAGPGALGTVEQDAPVELDEGTLRAGHLAIALKGAPVWEPCPNWGALRAGLEAIEAGLPALRAIALSHAPTGSLLAGKSPVHYVVLNEVENLRAGWDGDIARLGEAAAHLAGLGIGLTPAGDDFMAGAMLWARLAHPTPGPFCHTMAEAAAPRTTTLSAAFLRAAALGQCDADWHRLLAALSSERAAQIAPAVRQVMAHGATSGADMLAGFLWPAVGRSPAPSRLVP